MPQTGLDQTGLDQTGRPAGGGLRREGHLIGLLFASTTSIIGSGWLFGAFHASRIAGPWAIWSWVAGAVIIALIALCFAELGAMFPKSGALVHMSHASHGDGLGRIWGWMLFLCYVPIPAVESEAIVTYANNYLPFLVQPHTTGLLTTAGFAVCAALIGILALVNLLAVGMLLRVNTTITWWKIAVPVLTAVVLLASSTGGSRNLSADPGGYDFSNIFAALPAAGIVFSYIGFRTAIDLGGESANPGRDIPIAVIGSILLSAIIYILLQIAFLFALRPQDIAHGWHNLSFAGQTGPFAGLATVLGLGWLATLLYADAYVSPGGTGLIYVAGGARILYALGDTGAGPRWLSRLSVRARAPWAGVLVMWLVGILFLLPFPAWQLLVNYITSITVLTYGLGPVVLLVLRRNMPHGERRFRLRGAGVVAPAAFVCSNWIIYWTGFVTISFLFAVILGGFAVYVAYHMASGRSWAEIGWRRISWLLPWFGGMWVLSWLGTLDGGIGVLGFWASVALVGIWSLIVIRIALAAALTSAATKEIVARIQDAS